MNICKQESLILLITRNLSLRPIKFNDFAIIANVSIKPSSTQTQTVTLSQINLVTKLSQFILLYSFLTKQMRRRHSTYQNYDTPTVEYNSSYKYYQQRSPIVKQFLTQSKTGKDMQSARQVLYFNREGQKINEFKQQLRRAIEENEQNELSTQLEKQKNNTLKAQIQNLKNQNQILREQITNTNYQKRRLVKKIKQLKLQKQNQQKKCKKCQQMAVDEVNFQRQRDIYLKQRQLLQNQIKGLHDKVNSFWHNSEVDKLTDQIQKLRAQLQVAYQKITMQQRIITESQQSISIKQNKQISHYRSYELEDRIDQLRLEKTILKSDQKTLNSDSYNSMSLNSKSPFFSNSKEKNSFRTFDISLSENTKQDKQIA